MANTTIALKKSGTPAATPTSLANGELAINYYDGILYYKNATGQIVSYTSASDSFGIANVDGTLILSSIGGDVLSFLPGNNMTLSACSVTKSITFASVLRLPVSNVAPSGAQNGDLWWNNDNGRLFIFYADGDSGQWVEANPSGETINVQSLILSDAAGFNHANAAFDKANSANVLAFNTGIGTNAWSNTIATAGNNYTISVGASSNAWANSLSTTDRAIANAAANSANAYAVTVGAASNNYANASFYTIANGSTAFFTANIANAHANNISIDTEMKGFLDQIETYTRFDSTTNVFTLAANGAPWSYWDAGERFTISGNSTVIVPGGNPLPNGTYYVTIQNNGTGALTASSTVWDLSDPATLSVASIKFNNTCNPKYFLAEERHTVLMDSRTHRYLHFTRGTQAQQFGLLSGYTVNGTTNANNTCNVSATILNDEDIILTIPAKTAITGNANNYFVFHRYAANSWAWIQSDLPYKYTSGGFIEYDSSATMTQAANNKYVNTYLLFTNLDQGAGFTFIPGRSTYDDLTSAQAEDAVAFDMTGFGVLEQVVAYQFNWKTDSTLSTNGKCQLADTPRRIGTAIASVAPVYSSGLHNDMGGLQGGVPTEYYHLTSTEYTALQAGTMGISANTFANTKLANTSGVFFAGNLFLPQGSTLGIGSSETVAPLTISLNSTPSLSLSGLLIDADGSANSFLQTSIRNANTQQGASSDYIATTDDGSDTTNFIDLGINNSGFSSPTWNINGARDGYLYVNDSNLSIGSANTTSATKRVSFFVGGATLADEVMRIQDSVGGANVGIGRTNPGYKLDVVGTINASSILVNGSPVGGGTGLANTSGVIFGGNLGISTIATSILSIGPGGTANGSAGLKLMPGQRLTTPEVGAFEYDDPDDTLHFTRSAISGRGLVPVTQHFRLTADGSNIGGTIADFFGSNSSIPLASSGIYEIEMEIYYLKNTAGTVTWTLTNSTTVTSMHAMIQHTPAAGYTAVPTASAFTMGALQNQTAAATAFSATASLTNNTSHFARLKIILENGSSTSLRLRVTCSAGTVTPRRGSYWKAIRLAGTNAGSYSA